MPTQKHLIRLLLAALLWLQLLVAARSALAETAPENEVKALFVFNFARFVAWPATTFSAARQPFVIGILGEDPFGPHLQDAVRGESVDQHPLVVRHLRDITDAGDCQILFIDRSEDAQLARILAALDHHSTLTVSDLDDASGRGVMIQLDTEQRHVRLRINTDSARAAGLTISSNLLQLARIVHTRDGG